MKEQTNGDMVRLSKKSWHYKLQAYVFGAQNVPKLYNLCPYFWLTVFCFLITVPLPFVPIVKSIMWIINGIVKIMNKAVVAFGKVMYSKWVKNLDLFIVDEIFSHGYTYKLKIPKYFDKTEVDIANDWAKLFELDLSKPEDKEKFQEMIVKLREQRAKLDEKKQEYQDIKRAKKRRFEDKMEHMWDKVGDGINNWNQWKKDFAQNYVMFIRLTKKFMGILMMGIVTFVAFLVIYGIILLLSAIVSWIASISIPIMILWWIGYILIFVVLVVSFIILLVLYVQSLQMRIKDKQLPIWMLAVKYVVFYPLFYIVYTPVVFIWQNILVPFFKWIALVFMSLISSIAKYTVLFFKILFADGIGGFFKIFGESMGAAYGDYCKGVVWDDEKTETDV